MSDCITLGTAEGQSASTWIGKQFAGKPNGNPIEQAAKALSDRTQRAVIDTTNLRLTNGVVGLGKRPQERLAEQDSEINIVTSLERRALQEARASFAVNEALVGPTGDYRNLKQGRLFRTLEKAAQQDDSDFIGAASFKAFLNPPEVKSVAEQEVDELDALNQEAKKSKGLSKPKIKRQEVLVARQEERSQLDLLRKKESLTPQELELKTQLELKESSDISIFAAQKKEREDILELKIGAQRELADLISEKTSSLALEKLADIEATGELLSGNVDPDIPIEGLSQKEYLLRLGAAKDIGFIRAFASGEGIPFLFEESSISKLMDRYRDKTKNPTKVFKETPDGLPPEAKFTIAAGRYLLTPITTARTAYSRTGDTLSPSGIELVQNLGITAYVSAYNRISGSSVPVINESMKPNPSIAGLLIKPLTVENIAPLKTGARGFSEDGAAQFTSGRDPIVLPELAKDREDAFLDSLENEGVVVSKRIALLQKRLDKLKQIGTNVQFRVATPQDAQGKPGSIEDSNFLTRADTMVMGTFETTYNGSSMTVPLSDIKIDYPKGSPSIFELTNIQDSDENLTFTFTRDGKEVVSTVSKRDYFTDIRSRMESPSLYGMVEIDEQSFETTPNYEELALQLSAKDGTTFQRGASEGRRLAEEMSKGLDPKVVGDLAFSGSGKDDTKQNSPMTRVMELIDSSMKEGTEQVKQQTTKLIRDTFVKYTGTENKTSVTIAFNEKSKGISYETDYKELLNLPGRVAYSTSGNPTLTYSVTKDGLDYTFSIRVNKLKNRAPHVILEVKKAGASNSNFPLPELPDNSEESQESLRDFLNIGYKEFIELFL